MDRLLTSAEAAALLRVHPQTLVNWRCKGFGPDWIQVGGAIRYSAAQLEEWVNAQTRGAQPDGRAEREERARVAIRVRRPRAVDNWRFGGHRTKGGDPERNLAIEKTQAERRARAKRGTLGTSGAGSEKD